MKKEIEKMSIAEMEEELKEYREIEAQKAQEKKEFEEAVSSFASKALLVSLGFAFGAMLGAIAAFSKLLG